MTPRELEDVFNRIDANNDDKVSYYEFIAGVQSQQNLSDHKNMEQAFKHSFLTRKEKMQVFKNALKKSLLNKN